MKYENVKQVTERWANLPTYNSNQWLLQKVGGDAVANMGRFAVNQRLSEDLTHDLFIYLMEADKDHLKPIIEALGKELENGEMLGISRFLSTKLYNLTKKYFNSVKYLQTEKVLTDNGVEEKSLFDLVKEEKPNRFREHSTEYMFLYLIGKDTPEDIKAIADKVRNDIALSTNERKKVSRFRQKAVTLFEVERV